MTDNRLAVREAAAIVQRGFDDATVELIRKAVSDPRQPLSTDEFNLFLAVCQHTGLNPLLKEIYATRISGRFTILPAIDGYRKKAQQSPRFRGMAGPHWCGSDGLWTDVWLEDGPPAACRVGVYLPGQREPTWGVAYYKNYKNRVGTSDNWKNNPEHMLSVRAEAFALRKCFARELGSLPMPSEDDAGWPEVDGSPDEPELPPSPRSRAIAQQIDTALAEADALMADPPAEEITEHEREQEPTGELPGPRWGTTPLGRQVAALVEALTQAGKAFSPPPDDADDATLRGWIASKRTVLGQRS